MFAILTMIEGTQKIKLTCFAANDSSKRAGNAASMASSNTNCEPFIISIQSSKSKISNTAGERDPIISVPSNPNLSLETDIKSKKLRWFKTTPLGVPVEPEVLMMQNGSVSIKFRCLSSNLRASAERSSQFIWSIKITGISTPSKNFANLELDTIAAGRIKLIIFWMRSFGVLTSRFIKGFAEYIIPISAITVAISFGKKTAIGVFTQSFVVGAIIQLI